MAEPLDAVPEGTDVLIDSNILIYAITNASPQCRRLLERCSREEITGIALYESINDATHQFMKAEALAKRLCSGQAMKYLSEHPGQVKLLRDYWTNTRRVLALNLLFIPLDLDIIESAHRERVAAGLLTNDSVIVSAMRGYAISRIATADRQFGTVNNLTVFSPTDIP